jgi:hypothetical protein
MWSGLSTDIKQLLTVYVLSVSDHKPKPVQAQAIKARAAKFKLRYAGQAILASPSDKSGARVVEMVRYPNKSHTSHEQTDVESMVPVVLMGPSCSIFPEPSIVMGFTGLETVQWQ